MPIIYYLTYFIPSYHRTEKNKKHHRNHTKNMLQYNSLIMLYCCSLVTSSVTRVTLLTISLLFLIFCHGLYLVPLSSINLPGGISEISRDEVLVPKTVIPSLLRNHRLHRSQLSHRGVGAAVYLAQQDACH